MFGSKRIEELSAKVQSLTESLHAEQKEKANLSSQLNDAHREIQELKDQLTNTDFEALKEEARASKAEYEGLKELYTRKIQEFDSTRESKEQDFARDAALQRFNLENEITSNRQANQEYVASTVQSFSESYNYYLNQIVLLMDALGSAARETGEALFSEGSEHLKANFGLRIADALKSSTETLPNDTGDLVLINSPAEPEEAPEEPCEACAEVAEEVEAPCEACAEAAEEAVQEAVEEVTEEAAQEPAAEPAPEEA